MSGDTDTSSLAELEYLSKLAIVTDSIDAGDTVLEFGGGMGHYSLPLASHAGGLCTLDLSGRQCRNVREAAYAHGLESDIDVIHGDMRAAPLAASSFDAILCLGRSLSHVGTDLSEALTEFNRIGTAGATLVTSVVNRTLDHEDLAHALLRYEGRELVSKLDELAENKRLQENLHRDSFGTVYKFSPDEIARRLEAHGFEVRQTHATDRHTMFVDPLVSRVWDEPEIRERLLAYERTVGALPWFHNSGNMILQISRLETKL